MTWSVMSCFGVVLLLFSLVTGEGVVVSDTTMTSESTTSQKPTTNSISHSTSPSSAATTEMTTNVTTSTSNVTTSTSNVTTSTSNGTTTNEIITIIVPNITTIAPPLMCWSGTKKTNKSENCLDITSVYCYITEHKWGCERPDAICEHEAKYTCKKGELCNFCFDEPIFNNKYCCCKDALCNTKLFLTTTHIVPVVTVTKPKSIATSLISTGLFVIFALLFVN